MKEVVTSRLRPYCGTIFLLEGPQERAGLVMVLAIWERDLQNSRNNFLRPVAQGLSMGSFWCVGYALQKALFPEKEFREVVGQHLQG